ncbi:MAG: Hsp33 family molecular chaperone HslO, partial [Desulfobacula sp.]|uniref:Hsp33 family molecular chaperone HslO n=1 Tax=Desulfobacula sp. TaxID=2593537 RepID=UPI0025C6C8E9
LANYFLISEQIPTGFKLSVFFNNKEEVKGAGGIFLQALPGADASKVIEAEKMIQSIDSLGEVFAKGRSPEEIIHKEFSNLEPKFLSNSRVEFFCRCSKQRMEGYLRNLQTEEKKDMMGKGPFPVEVRCHHCNSVYRFSKDDLQALKKRKY